MFRVFRNDVVVDLIRGEWVSVRPRGRVSGVSAGASAGALAGASAGASAGATAGASAGRGMFRVRMSAKINAAVERAKKVSSDARPLSRYIRRSKLAVGRANAAVVSTTSSCSRTSINR